MREGGSCVACRIWLVAEETGGSSAVVIHLGGAKAQR
jgi:hypothetical protein